MPTRLALVYPGDAHTHRNATPQNNRFAALFAAFAAAGVDAYPVVCADGGADAAREQLLATLRSVTERPA